MSEQSGGSRLGRLARLGGLTSKVSGSYLGQRIKGAFQDGEVRDKAMRALHLENAERVVETMGALKGAAMKVGQSFALAADGLDLPPEVSGVLAKLNDKAEPIPFASIRSAIEAELEAPLDKLYSEFDQHPLGTASLAQAHRARLLDGREVVVKVLHPGIERTVDDDLATLKGLLLAGRFIRRPKDEIDAIFAEIRERLHEELDYYQEAANLESFGRRLKVAGVSVPRSVPDRSTGRVLTMDRIQGVGLDTFLETASPAARAAAGERLLLAFHEMFYKLRTLHADPHGGNYLFQPDGSIGILDFGCVKRFSPYWVGNYARLARGMILRDREMALSGARAIEIITSQDPDAEAVLFDIAYAICGPLMHERWHIGAEDPTLEKVKAVMPSVLRRTDLRGPPDLVFLHRTLGGIYGMLRKLELTYPWRSVALAYTDHAIGVAEGRIPDVAG
jgi:predicted unusual protein kinase regulating ubiquinone biosynthesis (AarF/ABC1/UbiB family)